MIIKENMLLKPLNGDLTMQLLTKHNDKFHRTANY